MEPASPYGTRFFRKTQHSRDAPFWQRWFVRENPEFFLCKDEGILGRLPRGGTREQVKQSKKYLEEHCLGRISLLTSGTIRDKESVDKFLQSFWLRLGNGLDGCLDDFFPALANVHPSEMTPEAMEIVLDSYIIVPFDPYDGVLEPISERMHLRWNSIVNSKTGWEELGFWQWVY